MASVMVQCLLGIQYRNGVLVAADKVNYQGVIVIKNDAEKLYKITDKILIGVNGDPGNAEQFCQFVCKNIALYKMRNRYDLGINSVVHLTRGSLAESIRTALPYNVNLLVAGYDKETGPQLFYMDYLASCVKVPYACHGYGGYLSLGVMDRMYKLGLSKEQGYNIIKECVSEIKDRFLVNLPTFKVWAVDSVGTSSMPDINFAKK